MAIMEDRLLSEIKEDITTVDNDFWDKQTQYITGNLCNFNTLPLNNLANPFADISSVIATKCAIFDNISHTTNIAFFTVTSSNLMIKFTISTSMASLVSYLLSTFSLVPQSCFSFLLDVAYTLLYEIQKGISEV